MFDFIMGLIGTLLYPLFGIIFLILDILQYGFYALAGIGDVHFAGGTGIFGFGGTNITAPGGGDGGENSTGLIYFLLTSPLIKNLFISIMVLALFLVIIFTAMAFIKNAYSSKPKKWQDIVGNAFKGLANFIFIPVCCLLGVWLSNILLVAVNGATSTGGATAMSRKLFIACAYNANIYRNANHILEDAPENISSFANFYGISGYDDIEEGQTAEYYAAIVDQIYSEGGRSGSWGINTVPLYSHTAVGFFVHQIGGGFYNLYQINYLFLIVGGVFMLYVMISLSYAMIKRMFILLMLFVISPALCAMYPLDEGAAVGNWKKEFIKYTIAAHGSVVALNLFFSILPIIENIELVPFGGAFTNEIFQLLMFVSGLFVVKEFMGTLSGWIGGDNAMASGESLKKSVSSKVGAKAVGKMASGAFKTMGKARGAYLDAKGDKTGVKGFFKGALGANKNLIGQGLGAADKKMMNFTDMFGLGKDDEGKQRKSAFAQGKKAYEKKQEGIQEAKDLQTSKATFDQNHESWGSEYQNASDANKNKLVRDYLEQGEDSGYDKKTLYKQLSEKTGEDVLDLKQREREANRQDKVSSGDSGQSGSGLNVDDIAAALEKALKGKATASGTDSHVEATMRERQEVALLKEIRDILAGSGKGHGGMQISEDNLLKLAKANQMSAAADGAINKAMKEVLDNHKGGPQFANRLKANMESGREITVKSMGLDTSALKARFEANSPQINAYNDAVKAKEAAERMAKEATAALIKEFEAAAKGNKLAEKAVEEFAKSMKTSIKDVEEFAKKLKEILNNK